MFILDRTGKKIHMILCWSKRHKCNSLKVRDSRERGPRESRRRWAEVLQDNLTMSKWNYTVGNNEIRQNESWEARFPKVELEVFWSHARKLNYHLGSLQSSGASHLLSRLIGRAAKGELLRS
jgi:hypothetical protein